MPLQDTPKDENARMPKADPVRVVQAQVPSDPRALELAIRREQQRELFSEQTP